jgi:hypothetical protein
MGGRHMGALLILRPKMQTPTGSMRT